jgi:DNA-binding XRE family transcriptional regulator
MLRLAHPAPRGQGTAAPARRKWSRAPALSLTPDEARHLRASLANTARAYGGVDVLAAAMGVPVQTLYKASQERHIPAPGLAIRLAAAAGTTVEAVLGGKLADAGRCPTCGAKTAGGAS